MEDDETEKRIDIMLQDFKEFLLKTLKDGKNGHWKGTAIQEIEIGVTWNWLSFENNWRGFRNDMSYMFDSQGIYYKNHTIGNEKIIEIEVEPSGSPSSGSSPTFRSPPEDSSQEPLPLATGRADKSGRQRLDGARQDD